MVETITPVVHGGRRGRWAGFLVLHVAGATLAAATFGTVLGAAGSLLDAPWGAAGLASVAALAALYLAREAFDLRVPVPQLRRQVPDWWRTFFPFGPASFLYGLGLGVGFLTYLTHGTFVVVSAAALASGRPLIGAALLAPFGLARGLSAIVAVRARTAEAGSALVAALARTATWVGWRVGHGLVLSAVLATAVVGAMRADGSGDIGAVAAAVLAVAFGAAGAAKLGNRRSWRRSLASYRLPGALERFAATAVPAVELAVAGLPFLGLGSIAGLAALAVLAGFSGAIAFARLRVGRRLDCGCFGSRAVRDYRLLLARNGALAVAAALAWREGVDRSLGVLRAPAGGELVPVLLAVLGLGLVVWVAVETVVVVRRETGR